ncbi:MAG TPA: FeoB-associated Cys-rich membrane protein [Chitinophagaceae bacterium]|nr:FeoB-associated Cys-rich membrane protein [Chitinophagales bacterium]HPG11329.1 FeoB-associated Cys-rich membrane protein [Chitinophagaceae bacterium]HRX92517.1 FeoB-associated Cys-rich membrane protein [Chitinophagaceae bacterium]
MNSFPELILMIYGVIGIIVLGILVYLIYRRIQDKKNEDFEKRDN